MIRYIFLIYFMLIFCQNSFCQNIKAHLTETNSSLSKSYSKGVYKIEFNNYPINEIITNILKVSSYNIKIDNSISLKKYSLKVESELKIQENELIDSFLKALNEMFSVEYTEKEIYSLKVSCADYSKLKCTVNKGEEQKILLINRTWKGYCVSSEDLSGILEKWYGLPVKSVINDQILFDVTVHHSDLDILKQNLYANYKILLENKSQLFEIIKINPK